jgi:thymidylate synthase (FAD)
MQVALLRHTPDPELTVALAARLCYSTVGIADLQQRLSAADVEAFLDKIMSLGHQSVLEHASFTFGIEGISRACSHQLVRHRLASYSQQSQRYVVLKGDGLPAVLPGTVAETERRRKIFDSAMQTCVEAYRALLEDGVPAEDARFVLPNAAETRIVMTMNARELLHFFALRCCERAQWEIRAMALAMVRLVRPVAPVIFRHAGPGCLAGPCPEGAFTCGRSAEVRAFFRQMGADT